MDMAMHVVIDARGNAGFPPILFPRIGVIFGYSQARNGQGKWALEAAPIWFEGGKTWPGNCRKST